jgi:hypothetical protein
LTASCPERRIGGALVGFEHELDAETNESGGPGLERDGEQA